MSALQELIESADRLCNSLDILAANDKKFSDNVIVEFERLSWEMHKTSNDLKIIQEYVS